MEKLRLRFTTSESCVAIELPVCVPCLGQRTARVPKWLYQYLARHGRVYWDGRWEAVMPLSWASRPMIMWNCYEYGRGN